MQKILLEMSVHTNSPVSQIDHFTVDCSVNWPLNGSKAGGDKDLTVFVVQIELLLCLLAGIKQEKKRGLYQSKFIYRLACIHG